MPRPVPWTSVSAFALRAVDDRVLARPEEDEVVAQPLEELDGLLDLVGPVARRGAARGGDHLADRGGHLRVVGDREPQLAERAGDLGGEGVGALVRQALDDLDPHHRLACVRLARVVDAGDRAVRSALDAEHGVQQRADREALRRDRAAHRVDEEGRVGRVQLEHGRAVRRADDAHRDRVAPGIDEREQVADVGGEECSAGTRAISSCGARRSSPRASASSVSRAGPAGSRANRLPISSASGAAASLIPCSP